MKVFKVKHCHVICLKFVDTFFTSLIKVVLEAKASIWSTIQGNPLLLNLTFSICHSRHKVTGNVACNTNFQFTFLPLVFKIGS